MFGEFLTKYSFPQVHVPASLVGNDKHLSRIYECLLKCLTNIANLNNFSNITYICIYYLEKRFIIQNIVLPLPN